MSDSDIIKNGSLKERLVAICDQITTFFKWSLEKETEDCEKKGSRRITQTEDLRKTVYKAKLEADINYGLGISTLYDHIPTPERWGVGWADLFGYSTADDFTVDEINSQYKFAYIVLDIIKLYKDWKEQEFDPMISSISEKLGTNTVKIDTEILAAVNKLVVDGRFKSYKYKEGGDIINIDDEFHISTVIGFSKDLTMWLTHIQNQEEFLSKQAENKVFITMFGKMDEVHPLYSNWLFTLHKGKTIWIVTDKIDFDNPYQKHARLGRRSAWRDQDAHYAECDLPYELFTQIDKLKGPNNKLVKNDSFIREPFIDFKKTIKDYKNHYSISDKKHEIVEMFENLLKEKLDKLAIEFDSIITDKSYNSFNDFDGINGMYVKRDGHTVAYAQSGEILIYKRAEVFFKQFSELKHGQQTFCILLMKETIQYLGSDVKPEKIMLAAEHTGIKLLEGATVNPGNPSHMEYWDKEPKEIFSQLLETLEEGEEKSTALALVTYDVVKKSKSYNASWLTTPEKLESLAEWSIIEDERKKLYPKVHALSKLEDEAYEWLDKQFEEKYDEIVKRMTVAKEVTFFGRRVVGEGFSKRMGIGGCGSVFEIKKSKDGVGIGKADYHNDDCWECKKTRIMLKPSKSVKRIRITHYREIMWLLGFDNRNQLHKYFRNFRAHFLIPYSGNSILDQTHPYLRIEDPCSDKNSNGMSFTLYMCGLCYRKIKQEDKKRIDL